METSWPEALILITVILVIGGWVILKLLLDHGII